MSCAASGSIIVRLMQLTPVVDGYAKLALLNVAGSGAVSAVALAPTGTQVRNWDCLKHCNPSLLTGAPWMEAICCTIPCTEIGIHC